MVAAATTEAGRSGWGRTVVVAIIALIVGGVGGFAIGSGSHSSTVGTASQESAQAAASGSPPVSPAATAQPLASPVTQQGTGAINTAPFNLAGGNYTVTYDFGANCFYGVELKSVDGTYFEGSASGTGPLKGTDHVYGLKSGSYYVNLITGASPACPWTVTLTPA